MKRDNKVIWINEGRVIVPDRFTETVAMMVDSAHREKLTDTYWWSREKGGDTYCDIDCYSDEKGALHHLNSWDEFSSDFLASATINRCLVLGDIPDSVKNRLSPLNPRFMSYFGGFSKDKEFEGDIVSDIIWSFEGTITNRDKFKEAMETITAKSVTESGSLMHLWCIDTQNNFFVLEHYINNEAAIIHLDTWSRYGNLFLDSTEILNYRVYSDLTDELASAVASLNPQFMKFAGGFSK